MNPRAPITTALLVRRLRAELRKCLVLIGTPANDRQRGQLEAIHHVNTVLNIMVPRRRKTDAHRSAL